MKRMFLVVIVLSLFLPMAEAVTIVKPGARCTSIGQTKFVNKTPYVCVSKGARTVWQVRLKKAIQIQPEPSPAVAVKTYGQRWDAVDGTALSIARKWMTGTIPATHTVDFIWVVSPTVDSAAVIEIKRRYDIVARYWSRHARVTNPLKVVIANFNEAEWVCTEKLAWLRITQPDCVEIQSNGRPNIPTAGQGQFGGRNIDMYQVDRRATLDYLFFLGRIEHEFTHSVFHAQWSDYQKGTACWMIEGGAEFFGILLSSGNDPDRYIQGRNIAAQVTFMQDGVENWAVDDWVGFLELTDRSNQINPAGDPCLPVRSKLYNHAILANEYLVLELGIPGYLELIRNASTSTWAASLEKAFGKSKRDVYRDIAQYMHTQYGYIMANKWSYLDLQKSTPYGR